MAPGADCSALFHRIPQLGLRKPSARTSFLPTPSASFAPEQQQQQQAAPSTGFLRVARSYSTPVVTYAPSNQKEDNALASGLVPPSVGPSAVASGLPSISPHRPPRVTILAPSPQQSPVPKPIYSSAPSPTTPSTHDDNIRVLLRIRPPRSQPQNDPQERRCLEVSPDGKGISLAPSSLQEKRFGFDRVFPGTCTQDDIFQDAGLSAVENTINGFNGCIFAYGQTGSGKTFTMLGETSSPGRLAPQRGLIPRIFQHMFARLSEVAREKQDQAYMFTLSCSYLEIYNEKVFDLLEESASMATQQPKSLREDANKEVYVESLREIPVGSEPEAIELLHIGSGNRRMASTDMNRESSRSHAVFTIKLVQSQKTDSGVTITRRSNLHLVDLAGSEKQRQTRAGGQRLKEAAQINKSLSALGNVIMSLVDVSNGQKRHVHYRDSKLTFLLRDSLGGNAITTIIAAISAEEKFFAETLSTLKFAQRAKFIKNNAVQNQDADSLVPLLKQEIERLRQEIAAMASAPPSANESPSKGFTPQPQVIVKQNRWEPALDVMEKLLKASGAASPVDLEEGEESESARVRCERLEMLLYRMICRYEEHKSMTYASDPSHRAGPMRPAPSLIQPPKLRFGAKAEIQENQSEQRGLSPQDEEARQEQVSRNNELEAENNLMRLELCDLLEWKAMVEDERKNGGGSTMLSSFDNSNSMQLAPNANEDVLELLNAYRLLSDEVCDLLDTKRPMLCIPRSPTSGSSVTEDTSTTYASGCEDGDDDDEFGGDDNEIDDGDVSNNYREMRRAHAVGLKLERKLDQYQDLIHRLEKELIATQDELETSSAATKFAEFQLQQMRDMAMDEEARQLDAEKSLATLKQQLHRVDSVRGELEARVVELQTANATLLNATKEQEEAAKRFQAQRDELEAFVSETMKSFDERKRMQDGEIQALLLQKVADDAMILEKEHLAAQHEIEHLQLALNNERSDSEKAGVERALRDAQQRIDLLEHELAQAKLSAQAASTDVSASIPDNLAHSHLQKLLDTSLENNAELLEIIRNLQVSIRSSPANFISSLILDVDGEE